MPASETFETVATPDALVRALPLLTPLSVKAMLLPLIGVAPAVNVADKLTVPPNVPVAASAVSVVVVIVPLAKQTVASFKVGVAAVVPVNSALYFRKRKPLNWASEPPLVKKV